MGAEGYLMAPINGTWHRAADKYRAWPTPSSPAPYPDSITNFQGWQRIIAKANTAKFSTPSTPCRKSTPTAPKPALIPSSSAGTKVLRQRLSQPSSAKTRRQGKLKKTSSFPRGRRQGSSSTATASSLTKMPISTVKPAGAYPQDLNGNEQHAVLRLQRSRRRPALYGNRTFVLACPYCPEWFETLCKVADLATNSVATASL